MKNQAIVILKPQTAKSQAATIYIEDLFDDYKINIVERRPIRGEDLECFGIIDSHYGDTATNAMAKKLSDVKINNEEKALFKDLFDEDWDKLATEGKILTAAMAVSKYDDELKFSSEWAKNGAEELNSDLYISYFPDIEAFVINGFYYAFKRPYTQEEAYVVAMKVEFDISWDVFNYDVIGSENPAAATEESIRGYIYDRAGALEITVDGIENVVHASRSAEEAERDNKVWFGAF